MIVDMIMQNKWAFLGIFVLLFILMTVKFFIKYFFRNRWWYVLKNSGVDIDDWFRKRLWIGGVSLVVILIVWGFLVGGDFVLLFIGIILGTLSFFINFYLFPKIAINKNRTGKFANKMESWDNSLKKSNITPGTKKEFFYLLIGLTIVVILIIGYTLYQIFIGEVSGGLFRREVLNYIVYPVLFIVVLWISYWKNKNKD